VRFAKDVGVFEPCEAPLVFGKLGDVPGAGVHDFSSLGIS